MRTKRELKLLLGSSLKRYLLQANSHQGLNSNNLKIVCRKNIETLENTRWAPFENLMDLIYIQSRVNIFFPTFCRSYVCSVKLENSSAIRRFFSSLSFLSSWELYAIMNERFVQFADCVHRRLPRFLLSLLNVAIIIVTKGPKEMETFFLRFCPFQHLIKDIPRSNLLKESSKNTYPVFQNNDFMIFSNPFLLVV